MESASLRQGLRDGNRAQVLSEVECARSEMRVVSKVTILNPAAEIDSAQVFHLLCSYRPT